MTKRRIGRGLFFFVLALLYVYVSTALWLFHGPFPALRTYLIDSLATTRHGYLLRPMSLFTLSTADITKAAPHLTVAGTPGTTAVYDFRNISDTSIQVIPVQESTFGGYVMLVRDPKRVKVGITKYVGNQGETVTEMAKDVQAVAGVNGGAFDDANWRGTGGLPLGITMHDGKLLQNDPNKWGSQPVIGITSYGELVAGAYNVEQLKAMGVAEAVSFGPVLVQNGIGLVVGNGNWGYAPRTAIGQRKDGTIIFVVTDGRFIHGANDLGASLKDIQDLMLQYGAITAANLDGGSSSTMYYNGKLVNEPTDVLGERKVATAFLVMPK